MGRYKLETRIIKKRSNQIEIFNITGDSCAKCNNYKGDLKILELHHIDPSNKLFNVSYKNLDHSLIRLTIEARKCLPLCPNCHRAYHLDYWDYSSLDLSKLKDYQVELIKNYGTSK